MTLHKFTFYSSIFYMYIDTYRMTQSYMNLNGGVVTAVLLQYNLTQKLSAISFTLFCDWRLSPSTSSWYVCTSSNGIRRRRVRHLSFGEAGRVVGWADVTGATEMILAARSYTVWQLLCLHPHLQQLLSFPKAPTVRVWLDTSVTIIKWLLILKQYDRTKKLSK